MEQENKNNILPYIPTGEELANEEARMLIEHYRIKAADKYAEKQYLLERDGVGFSPRGNVCAVAAEKKAGKSWFCMAMAAAATSGQFLGMKARESNLHAVYFDTEQDAGDGQRIQKRVHYVNGWDFEQDHDEFQIFHLREIDAKERRRVIMNITAFLKPDFVIVDGVRDLLTDFNAIDQSADVIEEHMRLSSQINCCIWDVLHVNPGSEKMRGHLGTELGNKVADIIFLTKKENPQDEDDVSYKAKETDARGHKNIHSITFVIDDTIPYALPRIIGDEDAKQHEQKLDLQEKIDLDQKMQKYLPSPRSMSWTKLRDTVRVGEAIGQSKAGDIVNRALELEIIVKASGKLVYNGLKEVKKPELIQFEDPFEEYDSTKPL